VRERSFTNFCRRLANRERLDVLRQVVRAMSPEGLTVGEISEQVRLKQPATSQYLAQLEGECGLVRSQREGRYVSYRFACDSSFAPAVSLGPVLRQYLRDEAVANHFKKVRLADPSFLRTLDALGNADRARVAAFLRQKGCVTKPDVQSALGLTELNVRRHLATLCDCGLAEPDSVDFRWLEPKDAVSQHLLDYLTSPCASHIAISDVT